MIVGQRRPLFWSVVRRGYQAEHQLHVLDQLDRVRRSQRDPRPVFVGHDDDSVAVRLPSAVHPRPLGALSQ